MKLALLFRFPGRQDDWRTRMTQASLPQASKPRKAGKPSADDGCSTAIPA